MCVRACVGQGLGVPRAGNVFTPSEKLGREGKHFENCLDKHTHKGDNMVMLIYLNYICSLLKKIMLKGFLGVSTVKLSNTDNTFTVNLWENW